MNLVVFSLGNTVAQLLVLSPWNQVGFV